MSRGRLRLLACLVLLALLLAGCADPSGAGRAGMVPDLFGTVVDETEAPLADADVRLPGLGLATKTDADGAYAFDKIGDEGHVELTASKQGHRTVTTHVLLGDDRAIHVAFTLASLDSLQAEQVVIQYGGFLSCWVQAEPAGSHPCPADPFGQSVDRFVIPVDARAGEVLESISVDVAWNATGPGADRLALDVLAGDEPLAATTGPATLRIDLDRDGVDRVLRDGSFVVQVGPDDQTPGVVAAQRFEGQARLVWQPVE